MPRSEGYSVRGEILQAVIRLMREKSYMDITVTDVIQEAQVARASFYRNFSSVSDVLDAIVEGLSEEFLEDVYPVFNSTDERLWREYLFHHFYHFAKQQRKMEDFHPQNISVLYARIYSRMQKREKDHPSATLRDKYMAVGKMGLIDSITKKWMDSGMRETPEEMINYIMTFITRF